MGLISGNEGSVKIGANSIAEVRNFKYTMSANLADTSTLGSEFGKVRKTQKNASGSVECWADLDNAQQNQLVAGAAISLVLVHTDGKQVTFPAVIETVEVDQGGPTGVCQRTINWKSNGAWS